MFGDPFDWRGRGGFRFNWFDVLCKMFVANFSNVLGIGLFAILPL